MTLSGLCWMSQVISLLIVVGVSQFCDFCELLSLELPSHLLPGLMELCLRHTWWVFSKDSEVLFLCCSLFSESLLHNFESPQPPRSSISVFSTYLDCGALLRIPFAAGRSRMWFQTESQGLTSLISFSWES